MARDRRSSRPRRSDEDNRTAAVRRWLGGEPAAHVAEELGITPGTLGRWARVYWASKLPTQPGTVEETTGLVHGTVRIVRDTWGIAHVRADDFGDVFFGLGYAMAQDRLWQLDYQRRLVRGELAAVLGRRALVSDRTMRIVGLGAAGDRAWATASSEVRLVLEALAAGINRWTEQVGSRLPVEFELLDYEPRPWQPADSIAIWKHRWWTLTGRLDLLVLAEAARRHLPPELAAAFADVELADETIVQPDEEGERPAVAGSSAVPGAPLDEGSNNWVVGGARTSSGAPVLCSDPHNAFAAPSQWFEAQLTGPGLDAAGAVYLGTPGLYLGRNRDVAWGLTNHMISVRDLYEEEVSPEHPGCYREGDDWQPFAVERQRIAIAGEPDEPLEIQRSARGPVVNALLPALADGVFVGQAIPPISLRWIGAECPSGFEASLALIRAHSTAEVRTALRQWPCPPLNYVYADRTGHFGYHAVGWVPWRARAGWGLRRATDPADAWDGFLAFEQLPQVADPARGWVATANNVPSGRADWYRPTGGWSDGYRARRIRERLTEKDRLTPAEIAAVHADVASIRARELIPSLLAVIEAVTHPQADAARRALRRWDYQYAVEAVGAAVWSAFWSEWCVACARARFPESLVDIAAVKVAAVARRLLQGEVLAWFGDADPADVARAAFVRALDSLVAWGGPEVRAWRWGRLHQVTHPHPLATTPELAAVFSTGPFPTTGGSTVRAAGYGLSVPFDVTSGSTYRLVADLSQPDRLATTQTIGQSALLGSPHYRDQARLWLDNQYHPFWMSEEEVEAHRESEIRIGPIVTG
jgi:penicillin amidase